MHDICLRVRGVTFLDTFSWGLVFYLIHHALPVDGPYLGDELSSISTLLCTHGNSFLIILQMHVCLSKLQTKIIIIPFIFLVPTESGCNLTFESHPYNQKLTFMLSVFYIYKFIF